MSPVSLSLRIPWLPPSSASPGRLGAGEVTPAAGALDVLGVAGPVAGLLG
jgi:hypothetical protein